VLDGHHGHTGGRHSLGVLLAQLLESTRPIRVVLNFRSNPARGLGLPRPKRSGLPVPVMRSKRDWIRIILPP
jgi:hypothetical protein